jgi:uncharacterized protein YbaP (TraB family)
LSKRLRKTAVNVVICLFYGGSVLFPSLGTPAASGKRSLWRLQSKNNVVYLMGSIHYLKPQNYPLDQALEAAFKNSKKLVLEINLESMEKEQGQKLMFLRGVYTDGRTLKEAVSEETYALAEKELNALGLDMKTLGQFKPWLVAMTISALKLQKLGFDPNYGIDRYFYGKAKKENREVLGLETLEYQINLFDGMSERTQEAMLVQTLQDIHSIEGAIDTIVRAWGAGDMKTLDDVLMRGVKEHPEVYQRLLLDRNRAWLAQIESYLSQNENYLVVVGAAHLAGKDSVIEMLIAKGYSVEQL